MEDLTLDSQQHNSTKADKQRGTLRRKLKKSKQNKEDGDASNDKDTKQEKEKHSKQHTKKDKKDKREKQRLSASVFSKNSSPSTSGSTGVGLSTHEFSYNASHQSAPHDDDDDASASSLGSSARTASPLTASSPPKLGSHISRSGAQFASSPELFASSSATPSKGSSSKGKEKKSHSSAAFEAIEPRQLHAKDRVQHAAAASSGDLDRSAAVTRGRSNSECVIEGFLEEALLKRMGGTHTRRVSKWRKRWARLYRCDAGTFLLTHDKPPASGKKAAVRSRIDVLAMVKVEKRDDIRRCAFVLMPDDCDRESPVYFCTDTEVERTSWMAAISRMQQQEMTDIVQPLRSRQSMAARAETELRPGMTTLNLDDLEEDKRRKHMVLINGEERKPLDIKEEQDQSDSIVEGIEEDSEEARMMRDIESRVQELSAQQPQPPHNLPSAPALSMSTMPSYYHAHSHPHQPLQMVQQHQHQQQVLLRQQSYMAVGAHQQPGSTLSGSYNPFIEIPANVAGAPAMPLPQQHHLQHQNSPYYMQPPVRRGSFVATDLSNSFSSLPQAQTVVMSTLSAATSPSTSTSIASISPHGTPPSGMSALPSPHIPPPFMRQSSSIHMAHHAHHALLSSAPSAVAQS